MSLYQSAFDAGITHFDTARSYGLGEAERTLGAFIKGRRDRITLTTKLGIQPPRANRILGLARRLARGVEKVLPGLGASAKQRAAGMLTTGRRFSVEDARASVETSLRELGTDYVDILLLHECDPVDVQPDLLEYLARCVTQGKARYTGIATSDASTAGILSSGGEFPGIVQAGRGLARSSPYTFDLENRGVVTHSVFDGLARVRTLLAGDPTLARSLSDQTGLDLTVPSSLPRLFLSYAAQANPAGIVLFSSRTPEHIHANVEAVERGLPAPERLETFATAVRTLIDSQ